MPTRLPKEIIFRVPPVGIISIQAGQMGYKKTVNIRLKKDPKTGRPMFRTKHGAKFVQSPTSKKTFVRVIKK